MSIVPGQAVSNGASIRFTVKFSEPVTGVTVGNFTVAANGPTGAAIIGNPTPNATGDQWAVDVSTGTGDGTLQLNLTSAGTWRAPVDELIRVGPLRVRVRVPSVVRGDRVRLLVAERPVASAMRDGWVQFELPSVLDHEVAVLG